MNESLFTLVYFTFDTFDTFDTCSVLFCYRYYLVLQELLVIDLSSNISRAFVMRILTKCLSSTTSPSFTGRSLLDTLVHLIQWCVFVIQVFEFVFVFRSVVVGSFAYEKEGKKKKRN